MIATYDGLSTVLPKLIHDIKMEQYIATVLKNKQVLDLANAKLDVLKTIHEPDDVYQAQGVLLAEITMEKVFHRKKTSKLLELEAKNDILNQLHSMCITPRTIHSGNR